MGNTGACIRLRLVFIEWWPTLGVPILNTESFWEMSKHTQTSACTQKFWFNWSQVVMKITGFVFYLLILGNKLQDTFNQNQYVIILDSCIKNINHQLKLMNMSIRIGETSNSLPHCEIKGFKELFICNPCNLSLSACQTFLKMMGLLRKKTTIKIPNLQNASSWRYSWVSINQTGYTTSLNASMALYGPLDKV